jgi:Nif-specific regulatory protein
VGDLSKLEQAQQEITRLTRERDLYLRLLALNTQEDLNPLLREALSLIVEVTEAERGYLALYNEQEEDPQWWIAKGFSEEEIQSIKKNISHGVIAAALVTGETITSDAAQDPRFRENESVIAQQIHAVLCAPIGIKRRGGVLYLQGKQNSQETFGAEDKRRAELFSLHLAPLVDRLLLRQQKEALLDPTLPIRGRLQLTSILGKSQALADVFRQVEKASRFELTVLLRGPSGTGKTAIARAIHENSPRQKRPFLELNCAAIPESLFESELFGAMQGAHSTANRKIIGKLAAAEGGTLFLDEIGELPSAVQAKLLQFLQSKEYFPLGATKAEKANVRLLAATNTNLEEAVRQKKFRDDLLYRLQVMTIQIPSLSERREDIALLMRSFCQRTCEQHQLPEILPSFETLRAAEMSEWPGNIRQLANAVEVATINAAMENASLLLPHHLFPAHPQKEGPIPYQEAVRQFQQQLVRVTLDETNWNVSEAARRLTLNRTYLHQLIQSLEIKRDKT